MCTYQCIMVGEIVLRVFSDKTFPHRCFRYRVVRVQQVFIVIQWKNYLAMAGVTIIYNKQCSALSDFTMQVNFFAIKLAFEQNK